MNKRGARAAAQRGRTEDPREVRELQELWSFRASRAFTAMAELLLQTDCTLRESWALRWTDIELTDKGLLIRLPGRVHSVTVDESSLDGVPYLSEWVFESTTWACFERAWRSIDKKLYLPADIFA